MNYGFWIHGELDREPLAAALAEMLSLSVGSVDVGDENDNDRNWDAPVNCTITQVAGDLQWHLDIYVSDAIPSPAPEPAAAGWLAARLKAVIAYQAAPIPPSAYWLVGPDGRRTRARIYELDADDELTAYRIDAVEHPLAALPGLPIAALPEVIRSYRVRTPVTDRLREQSHSWPTAAGNAVHQLGAWESMVVRLTEGWPPDGWYPIEYYREDLELRDELAAAADSLPEPAGNAINRAVAEVDRQFKAETHDGTGWELPPEFAARLNSPGPVRWWWGRLPNPLPWRNAPATGERE